MAELPKPGAVGYAAVPSAGLLLPAISIVLHRESLWRALFFIGLFIQMTVSMPAHAQMSVEPEKFGWKPSGFGNLVVGGASQGRGGGFAGGSETGVWVVAS